MIINDCITETTLSQTINTTNAAAAATSNRTVDDATWLAENGPW